MKSNTSHFIRGISTLQNPIGFFDSLYYNDGIENLMDIFFEDHRHLDAHYDSEKEHLIFTHRDDQTGQTKEKIVEFKKYLHNRLNDEFEISLELIDQHLLFLKSESEIRTYVSVLLTRLDYVINKSEDLFPHTTRYDDIKSTLDNFRTFIADKYSGCLERKSSDNEDCLSPLNG
jgi:hypothetical protein